MKVDNIDRKILGVLCDHARLSVSAISKRCGLSREVVDYRIKKLEQSKVIKSHIARIRVSPFVQSVACLWLKLSRFDQKRHDEIISFLANHTSVCWIGKLCGNYDIALSLLNKNSTHLADTISEITSFIGAHLKEHNLVLYISEYKNSAKGALFGKKEELEDFGQVFTPHEKTTVSLDKIDKQIMQTLAQNCRTKNVDISKSLGITEDLVRLRIKRLEKTDIIMGYKSVIDINKLGLESYYITLQIEQMTSETVKKMVYYFTSHPYVLYCARIADKHNILISLCAKNRFHFNDILLQMRKHFGEKLVDLNFHLEMGQPKETFLPEGFIEGI